MADYWIIQAVITVLIPIFTSQLEKAREATDVANIRATYAEASAKSLENDGGSATAYSSSKMVSSGAIDKIDNNQVGSLTVTSVTKDKYAKIDIDASGEATLSFSDDNK